MSLAIYLSNRFSDISKRFLFLFQKLSTFDNLLMEKPGNWFAVAMCEKHLKEK